MPKTLIFIPAKDEAAAIGQVISSAREEAERATGEAVEVLVIDDGSRDNTSSVAKDNDGLVIRHPRNLGLGVSFQEAVDFALRGNFDFLITMDGDGQFSSNDIPAMIKPLLENEADFVAGSRFLADSSVRGIPAAKRFGNRLMSRLISSILHQRFNDVSCGFRAYNRLALANLNLFGDFTYTQEVFLNLGYKKLRIIEVPISVKYFSERKSRVAHSLIRYGWQTCKIIFKSVICYAPMRLFGTIAAIFFLIGFPIFAALSVRYYLTFTITPFKGFGIASLILLSLSLLSFITGVLLQILSRLQLSIDRVLFYVRH